MKTRKAHATSRWHRFWTNLNTPRRDPAALTFARLGLLGTRW